MRAVTDWQIKSKKKADPLGSAFFQNWWVVQGSNLRPSPCKGDALPAELTTREEKMAERTGLEPATPGVTGRYSNQLNYRSALSIKSLELLIHIWPDNSGQA